MTPEEKAKEMVVRITMIEMSKERSLFEEIKLSKEVASYFCEQMMEFAPSDTYLYWKKVKSEVKKLRDDENQV